jgi:hypothetical protein
MSALESNITVLVLCQRKKGKDAGQAKDSHLLVENTTVPMIHILLDHFFPGKEYSVEYMSAMSIVEHSKDSVDYAFNLRDDEARAVAFVASHTKQYSLVLLNTCPFLGMNFRMIHDILKDDGRMVFSAFPGKGLDEKFYHSIRDIMQEVKIPDYPHNLFNFFTRIEERDPDTLSPIYVFQKKESSQSLSNSTRSTVSTSRSISISGFPDLESHANEQNLLPKEWVHEHFTILENEADGNCLFLSVAQLVPSKDHTILRKEVCKFYKTFDREGQYTEDSLEEKLAIAYITDNIEYHKKTRKPLKITHDKRVCKNLEYAGIMDIIVICILLQKNIVLLTQNEDGFYSFGAYKFSPDVETLFIHYNGVDHFEAMVYKSLESSLHSSRSQSLSKEKTNKRKTQKLVKRKTLKISKSLAKANKKEKTKRQDKK